MTTQHECKGLVICSICLKPITNAATLANEVVQIQATSVPEVKPVILKRHLYTSTCCSKPEHDPIHIKPEPKKEQQVKLYREDNALSPSLCAGHKCPSCSSIWTHNYFCGNERPGLCFRCASQTSVEINRPSNLEEIQKTRYITGRESQEIKVEHDAFVYNMTHNGDHSLKEDWQQKLSDHILNMQQMIERLNNKISASHQRKASNQMEEMSKLSPEERESYLSASRRQKKVKTEAASKEKQKKSETREYMVNKMAASLMVMNPKLSKEKALERANKAYEED